MTELDYMHSSSKKMPEFPPWAERSTTELWHASHETSLVKQLLGQTRFPLKLQRTVAPSRVSFWWCLACQLLPSALAEAAFLSKTHLFLFPVWSLQYPSVFSFHLLSSSRQECWTALQLLLKILSDAHQTVFIVVNNRMHLWCVCVWVFYVSHSSRSSLNVPPPLLSLLECY